MNDKPVVAKQGSQSYNYTNVQSIFDARLIFTGSVTGKRYEWPSAGAIVQVDSRDLPDLLVPAGNTPCCGGGLGGNVYFQVLGG